VRVNTLEGGSPGELRAAPGLNSRGYVADSRVEQDPEGEVVGQGFSGAGFDRFFGFVRTGGWESYMAFDQRQEGNGAGDGVRLHERSKALEGITP
jgi:hypothetical protein